HVLHERLVPAANVNHVLAVDRDDDVARRVDARGGNGGLDLDLHAEDDVSVVRRRWEPDPARDGQAVGRFADDDFLWRLCRRRKADDHTNTENQREPSHATTPAAVTGTDEGGIVPTCRGW